MALCHTIYSAKRALTDTLAKDVIKQMRQAIGDKALPVARAAAQVSPYYVLSGHMLTDISY